MKDATKEQLMELRNLWEKHGHYNENKTVLTQNNKAKTIIDGKNTMTNEVRVDIELPKKMRVIRAFCLQKRQSSMNIRQKMRLPTRLL